MATIKTRMIVENSRPIISGGMDTIGAIVDAEIQELVDQESSEIRAHSIEIELTDDVLTTYRRRTKKKAAKARKAYDD